MPPPWGQGCCSAGLFAMIAPLWCAKFGGAAIAFDFAWVLSALLSWADRLRRLFCWLWPHPGRYGLNGALCSPPQFGAGWGAVRCLSGPLWFFG